MVLYDAPGRQIDAGDTQSKVRVIDGAAVPQGVGPIGANVVAGDQAMARGVQENSRALERDNLRAADAAAVRLAAPRN